MKNYRQKKKAIVLLMAMVTLMLSPLAMNAQYDEGKFGLQPWLGTSSEESRNDNEKEGETMETENRTPLGSGIAIFVAAGAGYAMLKKKGDKQ